MNAITRKEVRLMMPAVLACLLLAAGPLILGAVVHSRGNDFTRGPAIVFSGLGALILGLSVFGQEISAGTLGLFLVQPMSRQELWRIKMRVLLASAALAMVLPFAYVWAHGGADWWRNPLRSLAAGDSPLLLFIVALTALSGGLWTTLALRQVAAAFWISLILPLALIMPLAALDRYPALEPWLGHVALAVLTVYSIVGFWLARRLFLTAQETSWTGGTISFTFKSAAWRLPLAILPRGPWGALVRKELQLQQVVFLITGVMVLWQIACFALRKVVHPNPDNTLFEILQLTWILWVVVPMAVGSLAVADERRLNTLEGTLCLPVSRRAQFVIKLVVTLLLGALLGGALPCAILLIGNAFSGDGAGVTLEVFCLVSAALTLVCFYGSALTRSFLQALGASLALVAVVAALALLFTATPSAIFALAGLAPVRFSFWNPCVVYVGGGIAGILILLWLPYRNFLVARPTGKLCFFNLSIVVGIFALFTAVNAAVAGRVWELFGPVEPRHGTARLAGPVRPKLVEQYGIMLALLPDGRLWLAQQMETRAIRQETHNRTNGVETKIFRFPLIPLSGTFVGSSNWADVAVSRKEAVAIRADGTLWRITSGYLEAQKSYVYANQAPYPAPASFSMAPQIYTAKAPVLEQIGTDSDWKSLTAGRTVLVALKKDGTLWGWGTNSSGVLGPDVKTGTQIPVRIGKDSDWISVFEQNGSCTAIKRDGSQWAWGEIAYGPNFGTVRGSERHLEPVRFPLEGTNWVNISSFAARTYALDAEGSLWAYGYMADALISPENWRKPARIGSAQWREIADEIRIRKDGTLWGEGDAGHDIKQSRYADWIAIRPGYWPNITALAADGTISHWEESSLYGPGAWEADGMIPSRKPAWNINILEAKNTR